MPPGQSGMSFTDNMVYKHGVTVDLQRRSNGHASGMSFTNMITWLDNHVQGLC